VSYTNADLVQQHLAVRALPADLTQNRALTLSGIAHVRFSEGAIDPDSLTVKSHRYANLGRITAALGEEGTALPQGRLVPGSVAVASDSSLGALFIENQDFVVDHAAGRLYVKEGGSLSYGTSVSVWYLPFTLYEAGVDYDFDADAGELWRRSGGVIANHETVLVDFAPARSAIESSSVEAAVRAANGLVSRQVDPAREFGADPLLALAATYLALGIVCRGGAARTLATSASNARSAESWLKLATEYSGLAERLLDDFRPGSPRPATPTHT
jgi:hypothetical protein